MKIIFRKFILIENEILTMNFRYEDPSHGKVTKEVVYDGRNKPYKIRKYEYNEDGTKRAQYNYLPNGKLFSYKNYEYIFEDQK